MVDRKTKAAAAASAATNAGLKTKIALIMVGPKDA